MRRKILWITFWLTMTLWLGQAWAQSAEPREAPNTPAAAQQHDDAARLPEPSVTAIRTADPPSDPHTLIDRSGWPVLTVGPADGTTTHPQAWLATKTPTTPRLARLDGAFDLPTLDSALGNAKPAGYSPANLGACALDGAKAAVYLLLLPVRAFTIEPFWQAQTTP